MKELVLKLGSESSRNTREILLRPLIEEALARCVDIQSVYLFGSRSFDTGSVRSDIDLLLTTKGGASLGLDFCLAMRELEPYLDLFHLDRGVAKSLLNESEIRADDDRSLIDSLQARRLFEDGEWQGDASLWNQRVLAKSNPAMTLTDLYDLRDPARERYDVLVLTALQEEFLAVKEVFNPSEESSDLSAVATFDANSGQRQLIRIAAVGEMGPVQAGIAAYRWLAESKAPIVILVGIAAGLAGKHSLGEVVVPTAVYDYELAKVFDGDKTLRPMVAESNKSWHLSAQSLSAKWSPPAWIADMAPLAGGAPNPPSSFEAVVASGAKVIADEEMAHDVTSFHGKASLIEMEGSGVSAATKAIGPDRSFLIVKSISDFADSEKEDGWHSYASHAAAHFARALIEHVG